MLPRTDIAPLMTGFLSRDRPINDPDYRAAFDGYIGRVNWKDLEPKPGQFSGTVIEKHLETAAKGGWQLGIRFYSGVEAPQHAKDLATGPISIFNPTDQVMGTVGAWWTPEYQDAYERAVHWIADRYDHVAELRMISMSLGGMVYPEPFLRSIGHKPTVANLKAGGLTTALDHSALQMGVYIHNKAFRRVRTFLAFNPGQNIDKAGTSQAQDPAWSFSMMEYMRKAMPRRGVFFSTSLDAHHAKAQNYIDLYDHMMTTGGPRAIQTEQISRVDDWAGMLAYGVALGMCAIETSPGGYQSKMSPAEAEAAADLLRANVKKYR